MSKYIALLRGVNVGGKNIISMAELKAAFIEHGFKNVSTYINSGNIIFESDMGDEQKIKADCEELLSGDFGMDIPVNIISAKDIIEATEHAPSWWNTDKQSSNNAIFVIPPVTVEEIFAQVGEHKPEYENVDYYGRVIFWSAPVKTFSRTKWSKLNQMPIYTSVTIRNANTALKLAKLVQGE